MRLYAGSSRQFLDDAVHNRVSELLKGAFFAHYCYHAPVAEVTS